MTTAQILPADSSRDAGAFVRYLRLFLNIPYLWGGTTPRGFDCSGLVQYAAAHFGVSLPRTAAEQFDYFKGKGLLTTKANAKPGDLVFFWESGKIGHVGVYLGGNTFEDAPHTGAVVRDDSLSGRNIAGFGSLSALLGSGAASSSPTTAVTTASNITPVSSGSSSAGFPTLASMLPAGFGTSAGLVAFGAMFVVIGLAAFVKAEG